jgi:DNA mismatch repair protein MutL
MVSIHRLPTNVVNAIAAGETIERPAYVIKELIENALDAGATTIDIAFAQAGLERIRVYDSGHGMAAEDLALAPLPHTTSKITQIDDLSSLTTFGFRGEALASISKVATLSIASRTADSEVGHVLRIHHGTASEVTPQPMAKGTTVLVERLFEHVPVRKKFLTNLQKERRLILEVVTQQALSSPQTGFILKDGAKLLLDLPPKQDLHTRLGYLYDQETLEQLVPIHFSHPSIKMSGYIGTPQLARKHAKHNYFFLNQRVVSFPILGTVIKKAYGSLLQPCFSPWFLLHLEMPSTLFDANIHPRKETVAFLDESQIIALINRAIVETLSAQDLSWQFQPKTTPQTPSFSSVQLRDKHTPLPLLHQTLRQEITPWTVKELNANEVLQIQNTYLIFSEDDGFTMVDQHAAHERILYEQFKAAFEQHTTQHLSSPLEPPFILNLSTEEDLAWQEHANTLHTIGFSWDSFGPHSYAIHQVPSMLANHDLDHVIPHVLDDLIANVPVALTNQTHRTLAYLACRSAVMAGDPLSVEEAKRLLFQLSQTTNNATCPHGRPTRIHMSKQKLEKLFGR